MEANLKKRYWTVDRIMQLIIGVVLAYCIKSAVENLSKNNRWPDKCSTAGDGEPPGAG